MPVEPELNESKPNRQARLPRQASEPPSTRDPSPATLPAALDPSRVALRAVEPPDWSTLWSAMVAAHAACTNPGRHAAVDGGRDLEIDGLSWSPGDGWRPARPHAPDSEGLFALYKPLLDSRRAGSGCVVAQLGLSLDGCVATHEGDSYFVSGPEGLLHLHRLRALSDAVLVGAGTVAADDPQLTTRRVPGAQPVRVVLDPRARLDGRARVLADGQAPSLWLCDARWAAVARSRAAAGCEVVAVEGLLDDQDRPVAGVAIDALAERDLRRVFVEGGGVTVSQLVAEGRIDHLHLIVAPVLTGTGRPGLQLPPRARMRDCPRPPTRLQQMGDDVLWALDLRGYGAWSVDGVLPSANDAGRASVAPA